MTTTAQQPDALNPNRDGRAKIVRPGRRLHNCPVLGPAANLAYTSARRV